MSDRLALPAHEPVADTLRPVRRWISVTLLAVGLVLLVASVPITMQRMFQWRAIGTANGVVTYAGHAAPGAVVRLDLEVRHPGPSLVVPQGGDWSIDMRADEFATTIAIDHVARPGIEYVADREDFPWQILLLPAVAATLLASRGLIPLIERVRHRRLAGHTA